VGNWLGLPILASEHGAKIDRLILMVHVLMIVLFVGWGAYFVYCLVRFRRKRNPSADPVGVRSHKSSYLEAAVAIAEIVLLAGVSIPFWVAEVDALPRAADDPFEVRVVAQQFAWIAHYPGPDGQFGRTRPDLVDDETNAVGVDRSDPAGKDDVISKLLYLPVHRPALVHLSSKDVIHSFAVPEFRVKHDAIPGMRIPIHFTPTMTTAELRERTGNSSRNFEIVCSQLCGNGHSTMLGIVYVQTENDVLQWIREKSGDM
jgi:cytochrome c oxidase subunit 2